MEKIMKSMSAEIVTLIMGSMPKECKGEVERIAGKLRKVLQDGGELSSIAMALVSNEVVTGTLPAVNDDDEYMATIKEEMTILRRWALRSPKTLANLIVNPVGACPFPIECDQFPCDSLSCNADNFDAGRVFKKGC